MRQQIKGVQWGTLIFCLLTVGYCLLFSSFAGAQGKSWQADWEDTLKAAEKEGEIVVYTSSTPDPVFREVFQKKFPNIKVTTVTGRGFQLGQRVLNERRAGKFIPDIFIQGSTTPTTALYPAKALDPIRPVLFHPEIIDQSKWWQGKHHYVDAEGEHIFMFEGSPGGDVLHNTELVKPEQIRSYWNLLDPKFKGKIVSMDPTVAGPASQTVIFYYHSPELGPEFLRRLFSEMDVRVIRADERLIDWVAQKKYTLGLFPRGTEVATAERAGLPLRQIRPGHFKEGSFISPTGLTVSLMNRAPHPSAAKLAANWFLNREGQMAWLEYVKKAGDDQDSLREDIPDEKRNPKARRLAGVKYFITNRYELIANRKPIIDLIKNALDDRQK